jgi:hypothetical protein
MIKRLLPWDELGHEVVALGAVLYISGLVAEDKRLDLTGQQSITQLYGKQQAGSMDP